ncbi:MAG: metalloprotease family protein [Bacillota bacterium]
MIEIVQNSKQAKNRNFMIGLLFFTVVALILIAPNLDFLLRLFRKADSLISFIGWLVIVVSFVYATEWLHEKIHESILKGGKDIGNVYRGRKYVIFDGYATKQRFLINLLAPFALITFSLGILIIIIPGLFFPSVFAAILCIHTPGCSSDFYSFYVTLKNWKSIKYVTDEPDKVNYHIS